MQDDLLLYYERELTYLRRMGAEFAARYPKVAARLELEPGKCEDPHVERLLEGFAFLTARVQSRIDDDLPEISEALLDVLHPQYVRPIPSMSLVELELDPELGKLPGGFHVPRGSELRSRPVQGMPCRFRTAYDTTLWPCTVSAAEWTSADRVGGGVRLGEAVGTVRLELRTLPGLRFGELEVANGHGANGHAGNGNGGAPRGSTLDVLRLHFAGEPNVADTLHELLLNNCLRVVVRDPDQPSRAPVVLPPDAIRPVGFEPEDTLLPYPRRAFAGYALLQELFAFPQKFLFADVDGVARALRTLDAGPRAELFFVISPFERAERRQVLEVGLSPRAVRLGCTPVVNLFEHVADPILLTERQPEYVVIPDVRRRLEIEPWSVDRVVGVATGKGEPTPIEPLYAFRHGRGDAQGGIFWHAMRRASGWRTDRGTDVHLSFADLSGRVRAPEAEVASLTLTCFNGDLPSRLPFGVDERGDFELAQGGPVRRIMAIVKPTPVIHPPLGKPLMWRLVSTLSLNHLSLVEEGREALRELLRLHNAGDSTAGERHIQGLVRVDAAPSFARVIGPQGIAFARGRRVEIEFDEEQFPGGGLFVFANVLERFLALYASMNSFTQLTVRSRQRKRVLREWAPRAGCRTLV
ncbi:type VI secretion system baseplate subunit TssF [Roseisolibacter agri]|uniref:Type VI secretion system protein n=1 Tax=Roseisolibacter agri TaxID=2014610 RepID=A0AA37V0R2_9BACT|nr:type VI secretion system baseplate subunit TssF [Roseisolibacter agri]GLC25015.1 type VI secretion system protein [Roseisolibacter agri]